MDEKAERAAFEAWMREDSTTPLDRDEHGYRDMVAALMWHAYRAALAAAPAPHPDTADAERWRFTRDNRVQYFEPTKLWRMTDANGRLVCEGVADSYEAAIDAARAQARKGE